VGEKKIMPRARTAAKWKELTLKERRERRRALVSARLFKERKLENLANRIRASGAKEAWVYFNNDSDAYAPKNAIALRRLLG
jgi:uncharacterized protein YecE (DUF72 family)